MDPDDRRGGHPVSLAEVEFLARSHGMQVVRAVPSPDLQKRPEISWTAVVLLLTDDGTGALPLLRHLILMDAKSATYKLGLLRSLCRAADGSAGLAEGGGDEHVQLPLGLVALNRLRLYLPLAQADLPQAPENRHGAEGFGFTDLGWLSRQVPCRRSISGQAPCSATPLPVCSMRLSGKPPTTSAAYLQTT
jgi:hypothetical protein